MSETSDTIKKLLDSKKYDKIVSLTEHLGDSEPDMVLREMRGEALFRLGRRDEALQCFRECIRSDLSRIDGKRKFLNSARFVTRIMGKKRDASIAFWQSCIDPRSEALERAAKAFLKGDHSRALDIFARTVTDIFGEGEIASNWIQSFEDLIAIDRDGATFPGSEIPSVRKIFLSGMGWSGSSALRDYFREFPRVMFKSGEYQYIEDGISLLDVHDSIDRGDDWKRTFLTFYMGGILGFSRVESYVEYKHVKAARAFSIDTTKGALELSHAVRRMIRAAAGFFNAENEDRRAELFLDYARDFVNLISSGAYYQEADCYILDNVIHIRSLDRVGFIDNAYFFPTFRDPRSMHVSRQVENRTYLKSAEKLVFGLGDRFRMLNGKVKRLREQMAGRDVECTPVQFERFVMDEAYREGLARDMGLDPAKQKRHKSFKPWMSARNVYIHETHGDPEEIRLIEKELPEYCIDLEVYRAEAARLEAIAKSRGE